MKRRLFTDSAIAPTEALLRRQLSTAMPFYTAISSISGDWPKQWQYNRGNGWILKVDDTRKALYYLIAFEEGIEISLTVRDSERTEFMENIRLVKVRPQLEAGTRYAEGYALRFEIENENDCRSVCEFLTELIKLRLFLKKSLVKKRMNKTEANIAEGRMASATKKQGLAKQLV
jgi:hypothetical protein